MNNDSTESDARPSDSLFHKAASFAVFALVSSFVLQFIYGKIWLRLSERASELAGLVPLVVMISAIPAGFIALCGIPRYGKKKLLWKGLLGLIAPIVLFWVSVQIRESIRDSVRQHPEWLKQDDKPSSKP